MKQLRLSAAFLAALLLIVIGSGVIVVMAVEPEIPNPTREFYVNDFAGILDYGTEQDILELGESTYKATGGGQVVFVSIDTLGDFSIEEYANALFNKWKIGTDDKGILFIISMQERKTRIEVGYGYEGILTDLESSKLLSKFAGIYAEKGMDEAVKTIYFDLVSIVSGNEDIVQYPETIQTKRYTNEDSSFFRENPIIATILVIIVLILIVLDFIFTGGRITFFILRMTAASARRGGGRRNSGGGGRSGGGGASGRF
ncbi:MAG: TPM domain-containing protein [Gracilibacteraceae bacterium]|nr:TPM domain-containing protein [Gracilibacteraceae bacterium]